MNFNDYLIVLSEIIQHNIRNKCLQSFLPLLFLFFINLRQLTPKKNAELREDIYRKFTII